MENKWKQMLQYPLNNFVVLMHYQETQAACVEMGKM